VRIVRKVNRLPKIFLAGAVLTVAYVVTTTVVGWDGWLIAVVGLGLGFVYLLIAIPLALGPSAAWRTTEISIPEAQMTFELPGVGQPVRVSARTWSRRIGSPVWGVPRHHGNGSP
jgi:hypothetical protein